MRRVLKYTNAIGAVLLLGALGVGVGFVWRTMPQTGGGLELALSGPAKVVRDKRGIPHIEAATVEDAIYAQGYVHAQDRFWQMEATRRLAAGEMAEIVGQAAVESDVQARQMRLRRVAQQMADRAVGEDRKWLAAYARGVNDWMRDNRERMPLEIRALGYTPAPWRMADSLLLVMHMFRTLSNSWTVEADQMLMLSRGGNAEKVKMLFPTRSGTEIQMGSNGWAVSGARTVTGKPVLAGDPHLQMSWPATFYVNHLKAGEMDVIGGSLPGGPGVIIGHNREIAWTMTTLHFDVQDLYYNDPVVLGVERETIRVKGGRTVELTQPWTRHGPLVERNGMRMALRWSAWEGKFPFAFRGLNLARTWEEFRQALAPFPGPCHNFIYADRAGNIGYQAAGQMPLRKTAESGLPLDGSKPENDWQGFIPFAELPTALNPKSGVLISANQNPFPAGYKYPVAGIFTPPYRQKQIARMLAGKEKWAAGEMSVIQKDVYSEFHHGLARQLAAAAKTRLKAREDMAVAIELLEGWDGQMEVGRAAPVIVALAYEEIKRAVVRSATAAPVGFESHFAPTIVAKLLRERPKAWFADYDQMLVEALLKALDQGARQQGKNPKFWDYGRLSRTVVTNLVLSEAITIGKLLTPSWMPFAEQLRTLRVPLIDGYVQVGPVPMSGTALTVKQVGGRVLPAFRFIADTADWDKSYFTLMLGQSGHAFSRHSRDQWEAYYSGQPLPLAYDRVEAEDVLVLRPSR
ncbi:MAG: penicillin acylase family protein [Bryobacter sp.]|nr:penicillin acylase family protein [Bryobacter sp. CoA8 C33]